MYYNVIIIHSICWLCGVCKSEQGSVSKVEPCSQNLAHIRGNLVAKVCLDDALILQDIGRLPFRKKRAGIKHDDAIAEFADKLHVVLNEDDGFIAGTQFFHNFRNKFRHFRKKAREWFVKKNSLRACCKHPRDFKKFTLSV